MIAAAMSAEKERKDFVEEDGINGHVQEGPVC